MWFKSRVWKGLLRPQFFVLVPMRPGGGWVARAGTELKEGESGQREGGERERMLWSVFRKWAFYR